MHLRSLICVNRYFKLFLVGIISAFGIYLAFQGDDFGALVIQIQQINYTGVFIASLLLIISCIVRAYRWQVLLSPVEVIPLHPLFGATLVGYFGNGVLAFRMGELLRAYVVARGRKITVMQAFGTVILERILDLVLVVCIFAMTLPWFPFEDDYSKFGAFVFTGITCLLIVLIIFTAHFNWLGKIEHLAILNSHYGQKLFSALNRIFEGLTIIKKTNHVGLIILSSLVLWGFYFFITMIVLNACGLSLGFVGTGILLVLGSIVIGIPALPGSAGTYDAGIKYSLMMVFNIVSDKALTYAIVSHAISYFPLVLIGAVYFMLGNISLKEVKTMQ